MKALHTPPMGRLLFALALLFFAAQFIPPALSVPSPVPGPPWLPTRGVWNWAMAAILLSAAAGLAQRTAAIWAARGTALFLGVYALIDYAPKVLHAPRNPASWTGGAELAAIASGAWMIGSTLRHRDPGGEFVSRCVLAAALVVFSIQHFLYARFIATLIPAWIPWRLWWAYGIGIAFGAAALAIATRVSGRVAALLLALMFGIWVCIVHLPRVVTHPRDGNEWTSLLIAFAMMATGKVFADALGPKRGRK